MTKTCEWHLCEKELTGLQRKFCSKSCKTKLYVTNYRKKQKRAAVEYKGGKCQLCGYDKCVEALQFHHLDPNEKDFGIGGKGETRKWETIKTELDKCICLCANCHAEVHAGLASIGRATHL